MSNLAIAHKDYDVRGGGEILAERLAEAFDVPLYVGHSDPDNQPDESDVDIRELAPESRWHRVMEMGGAPRGIAHMMHWRDNADALHQYDCIITSGNEPLWAMTKDRQTVVAYTHSTPRWMYDLYHQSNGFVGRTYQQMQRRLYEGAVKRPDLYVANSDLVARRIRKYWNIPEDQIRTVYPPIDCSSFDPADAPTEDGLYVTVGRLGSAKNVDTIIEAANELGIRLLVAGDGPERERLEDLAGPTVELLGYVSEERKRRLLSRARAFVMAAENEDFGMSPVEAMAAGTPVIGVDDGFTAEQIKSGCNGSLWSRGRLKKAIETFQRLGVHWDEETIATFAEANFGTDRFRREMRDAVDEARRRSAVKPDFVIPDSAPAEPAIADGGDGCE